MTEDRKLQLMQEALDTTLSPEQQGELSFILAADPDDARQYDALQQVDALLRTAPYERAPERLALTVMARLGQMVMESQAKPNEQDAVAEATMRVVMSMVTVATLPLMIGASWMLLNALTNPEAFEAVLVQVAGLMLLMIDTVTIMLQKAQEVFQENPEAAIAMIALIPVVLLALVKQVLGIEDEDDHR